MCEICHSNPCKPQCPNFEYEPLMYCEDCVSGSRRTADRELSYNGKPAISYGDKWEE